MNPDDLKHCPICTQDLPVEEFGICRARKSGRNLYCKSCIRQKVTASRRALKEYKTARKRYVSQAIEIVEFEAHYGRDYIPREAAKKSPLERVREAIHNGARTQREIGIETKLGKDEIGDALTHLLLWNREIKTELRGENRIYFFPESKPEPVVNRKPDVPSGFHCLYELGPGRKRAVG